MADETARYKGARNEYWATPQSLVDFISMRLAKDGWGFALTGFDLDAAATAESSKGFFHLNEADDALSYDWCLYIHDGEYQTIRSVWLNPPFQNLKDWMAKVVEEAKFVDLIAVLIPARTDTRYFMKSFYRMFIQFTCQGPGQFHSSIDA